MNNSETENSDSETLRRRMKKTDNRHKARKYFREYTEYTGIHGLRYLTEKRSKGEKIIWAVILLASLAGCLYMIYEILDKFHNSPVVVSFATEDTPIYQIPFPAVTICSEAKYTPGFDFTTIYRNITRNNTNDIDEVELKKFYDVSLVCDGIDSEILSGLGENYVDESFFSTIDEMQQLTSMFILCNFMGKSYSCGDLFKPILTDEGICYSFNILNRTEIFRDNVALPKTYYNMNNSINSFNLETGYDDDAPLDTYPRRAVSTGVDNGLEVFFTYNSVFADNTICSSYLEGWRILVHSPYDVPRLSQYYFRIPFEKVVVAAIEPSLITTADDVRNFSPDKRKCFMMNERHLAYFNVYTQSNCIVECITNHTLSKCGCVAFHMPRENSTRICGTRKMECLEKAESEAKSLLIRSKDKSKATCDCRPSCSQLKFSTETSHSNFNYKKYFGSREEGENPVDEIEEAINLHFSVMSIYFKNEHFMPIERNQLYGTSDLVSNFGGLLGLFTGFSLISFAEIIYFLSVRLFCNKKLYNDYSGPE